MKIHSSCEIENFVETHLCKLCVILRSRALCTRYRLEAKYLGTPYKYTTAPLHGRLTPPATLAQGRMQLKHVKGAERRGPSFVANGESIMPRAACAELIALCCAVCLLAVSHSNRQYGCNFRGGKNMVIKRDQLNKNQENEYTTRTYRHLVPGTAFHT